MQLALITKLSMISFISGADGAWAEVGSCIHAKQPQTAQRR